MTNNTRDVLTVQCCWAVGLCRCEMGAREAHVSYINRLLRNENEIQQFETRWHQLHMPTREGFWKWEASKRPTLLRSIHLVNDDGA